MLEKNKVCRRALSLLCHVTSPLNCCAGVGRSHLGSHRLRARCVCVGTACDAQTPAVCKLLWSSVWVGRPHFPCSPFNKIKYPKIKQLERNQKQEKKPTAHSVEIVAAGGGDSEKPKLEAAAGARRHPPHHCLPLEGDLLKSGV